MIVFDKVTKIYPKSVRPSLNKVSLRIHPKEFVVLVGTSGAGKSTLLKLLSREIVQSSGKIVVGGLDYDDIYEKEIPTLRRRIGTVFQDFKLLTKRTVYENIAFALELSGATNQEIRSIVPQMIQLVGLTAERNYYPYQLSGGQQQRVAIARAMVRNPKILIADEPTGNLDQKNSLEIVKLLEKINEHGTTVLMVTHDVEMMKKLNKRTIVLDEGRIVSDKEGQN